MTRQITSVIIIVAKLGRRLGIPKLSIQFISSPGVRIKRKVKEERPGGRIMLLISRSDWVSWSIS
jgi:hypothetical protein